MTIYLQCGFMKSFDIPTYYLSPLISRIKAFRKKEDRMKKDFTPTLIDLIDIRFHIARHFGFCYGVENAIEIAFKTVSENENKRIFLLSEMIHNPKVNDDLKSHGVQFIQDTKGNSLVDWSEITSEDIVIVPAFGTTLEIEALLKEKGINPLQYNTTCPFVEKVWNRSSQIGKKGYSIIVHGKPIHEETRATFSHSDAFAPTLVIKNMEEAISLKKYLTKEASLEEFEQEFKGRYSDNFNPLEDLEKIGVVNQTTMLAEDTQAIADYLKASMSEIHKLNEDTIKERFADTRDTLCYATNDNQSAVKGMLEVDADLAFVVGGYNSSNTSHLVELCEEKLPTFYIKDSDEMESVENIRHFDFHNGQMMSTKNYFPTKRPLDILITAGASCPDIEVEKVMAKIAELLGLDWDEEKLITQFSLT